MSEERNHIEYPEPLRLSPCGGLLVDGDSIVIKEIDGIAYLSVKDGGDIKDYNDLSNKPSINGVELIGDKTSEELNIYAKVWEFTVTGTMPPFSCDRTYDEIKQAIEDGYFVICNYEGGKFHNFNGSSYVLEFDGGNFLRPGKQPDNINGAKILISPNNIEIERYLIGMKIATRTTLGGIKVGDGLEVTEDGVLSTIPPEPTYFIIDAAYTSVGTIDVATPWADIIEAYESGKELRLQLAQLDGTIFELELDSYTEVDNLFRFSDNTMGKDKLEINSKNITVTQGVLPKAKATELNVILRDDAQLVVNIIADDVVNHKYTFDKTVAEVGTAIAEGREVIIKSGSVIPGNNFTFRLTRRETEFSGMTLYFHAAYDSDVDGEDRIRRVAISTNAAENGEYVDTIVGSTAGEHCIISFVPSASGVLPPADVDAYNKLESAYASGKFIEGKLGAETLTFSKMISGTPNAYEFDVADIVTTVDGTGRTIHRLRVRRVIWDGSSNVVFNEVQSNEIYNFDIITNGAAYVLRDDITKFEDAVATSNNVFVTYDGSMYVLNGYDATNNSYKFVRTFSGKTNKIDKIVNDCFTIKVNSSTPIHSYTITREQVEIKGANYVGIGISPTDDVTLQSGWTRNDIISCLKAGAQIYLVTNDGIYAPYEVTDAYVKFNRYTIDDDGNVTIERILFNSAEQKHMTVNLDGIKKIVATITPLGTTPETYASSMTLAQIQAANAAGNIVVAQYNGAEYCLSTLNSNRAVFYNESSDGVSYTNNFVYVNTTTPANAAVKTFIGATATLTNMAVYYDVATDKYVCSKSFSEINEAVSSGSLINIEFTDEDGNKYYDWMVDATNADNIRIKRDYNLPDERAHVELSILVPSDYVGSDPTLELEENIVYSRDYKIRYVSEYGTVPRPKLAIEEVDGKYYIVADDLPILTI